jgi:M6 family metalloprotease-like protein
MSHPFFGEEFEFTQPDGSTLRVRGWGDQQNAVFETIDGRRVQQDPATGYFKPVEDTRDGTRPRAAAPDVLLGDAPGMRPGLPTNGARWQQRRKEQQLAASMGDALLAPPQRETVGTFVGLCLLVQFPDVAGTITREEVDNFCNKPGYTGFGNNGSVFDYYRDVSGGRVNYTNLVAPYYTAKNPRSYYTDESVRQPIRAIELITEALDDLIISRFDVSSLSTDNLGFVYALNVFYAGKRVNNWAQGLWPHAHFLTAPYRLRAGMDAHDYQITDMANELSLGTFCHENGHMLCDFPDLYDYGGESFGVGPYCLMCAGGNISPKNPVHIGAYLKFRAGWAESATALAAGSTITLRSDRNQFALQRKSNTEYYVIENRQKHARDTALPAAGLAIWHVDELGDNSNEQMSPTRHYECTLVQADGKSELEQKINNGDPKDLFSAAQNGTFGHTSEPPSRWWDGTNTPLEIVDITTSGVSMKLSVR